MEIACFLAGVNRGAPGSSVLSKLLFYPGFVNEFARLAKIRMEYRGSEKRDPLRAEEVDGGFGPSDEGHTSPRPPVEH